MKNVSVTSPAQTNSPQRPLRVAAYCRVSTVDPCYSIEAQTAYYTEKINGNKNWIMAGIFADEGFPASQKLPELQRLLRQCKNGEVDVILAKSVSRLARNMDDCIDLVKELRELGITVVFEKEQVTSQDEKFDTLVSIYTAIARMECECITRNFGSRMERCVIGLRCQR